MVVLGESPSAWFVFSSWSCTGAGCYAGTNPTPSVTMNNPINETATFTPLSSTLISVVRGTDNGIYYGWNVAGNWAGWLKLPGATLGSIGAVRCGGVLYFAVQGTDDGIYFASLNLVTSGFSGWSQVPGGTLSGPG
jgi:hypothetical protein